MMISTAAAEQDNVESNNNSATMMGVEDTAKLRRVLRAVHCLQQERGASCAFCVCLRGEVDRDMALLRGARADTDRALANVAFEGNLVEITLSKIRKLLDRHRQTMLEGEEEQQQGGCGPHAPMSARRLLVSFSTLISAVLHENVIRHTVAVHHKQRGGGGGSGAQQPQLKHEHSDEIHAEPCSPSCSFPRVRSFGDITKLKTNGAAAAAKYRRRRRHNHSDMDPVLSDLGKIIGHHQMNNSHLHNNINNKKLLPRMESGDSLASSSEMTPDFCNEELIGEQTPTPTTNKPSMEQNRYRRMNLLGLLVIFVRLKESNGVERASLTSILMSSSEEDASRLLSDVALEVENQRRLLEELKIVPPGSLRNLVTELVTMSPEMSQFQTLVLGGLSLDCLWDQYDSDKLWDVMTGTSLQEEFGFLDGLNTAYGLLMVSVHSFSPFSFDFLLTPLPVYIDKLHSLELLIVEEIDACSPPPTSILSNPVASEDLSKLIGDAFGVQGSADELLHSIQSMSPAEVKKRMISVLGQEPTAPPKEKYSKKGVDELLRELSTAPASEEWEIDIYELRFLKRIGQGSAGTTYAADWAGLKVAVKVASITEMGLEGWRTEVQALQKLHHPNIIRLLGSVYHANPLTFCLVLEYCDGGDLASAALCKVTPRNFFFHVSTSISKGLNYLHNRSIIHRG